MSISVAVKSACQSLAAYLAFAEVAGKDGCGRRRSATPPPADGSRPAGTFPQLISVRQPESQFLPGRQSRSISLTRPRWPAGAKVLSAAKSTEGTIWVVNRQGGSFVPRNDRLVPLEVGPKQPEPRQPRVAAGPWRLVAVATDKLGSHLGGDPTAVLFATDGTEWWQPLDRKDGVPYETMTGLHLAANGDVWGGTREGAWRLRDGNFRYFWGKRWMPGKPRPGLSGRTTQVRTWLDNGRGPWRRLKNGP